MKNATGRAHENVQYYWTFLLSSNETREIRAIKIPGKSEALEFVWEASHDDWINRVFSPEKVIARCYSVTKCRMR